MKFISIKLFTILIIALVLLSLVESRKNKKKIAKKSAKKLNRLLSEAAAMVTGFDWEKDPFLKHLKDQSAYMVTANSTKRYFLIEMVIGKTLQLLKVKDADALVALSHLDEKQKLEAFTIIMKTQKSGDLSDLKPIQKIVNAKAVVKGLSDGNFVPGNRGPIMKFFNLHIRQSK